MSRMIDDEETLKDNGLIEIDGVNKLLSENKKLKKEIKDLNFYIDSYRQVWEVDKYRKALEDIRTELLQKTCANSVEIRDVLTIIDEVLNLTAQIDR